MNLKPFFYSVLLAALLLSCVRESPETVPEVTEIPPFAEKADPSFVKVLFSDEMTTLIEEDLSRGSLKTRSSELNGVTETLGVESMERLFPFAGEFEPRTRKEGLHRWYKVVYASDVPVTRAAETFSELQGVEYVEEPIKASLTTNDKYW